MEPELTVVIPTRDRWPLMTVTSLASALRQEDVQLEVVIVDDGSTQPPPAHPGLRDPRVRLVRHTETRGVAVARNTGMREAHGTWVAFLDDDDLWAPRKLRAQLDAANTTEAGFAYSAAVWVDEALRLVHGHAPPPPDGLDRALLRWNVLWGGGSNVVARTDLLRSLAGFDEELFQLADWDLWIRLAGAARGALVHDVQVALVMHQGSMLLVDRRDVFEEFHLLVAKHRGAADRLGVEPDRAQFARWVAAGHLRAGRRTLAARTFVRGTLAPGNVVRAGGALLGREVFSSVGRVRGAIRLGVADDQRVAGRPEWLELYL